jgi:hypothetical protein
VRGDVFIDNDALLVTDFINLKIKLTQSFRYVHKNRVYVHVFIEMNNHTYTGIYVYCISQQKFQNSTFKKKFRNSSARPDWWCPNSIEEVLQIGRQPRQKRRAAAVERTVPRHEPRR